MPPEEGALLRVSIEKHCKAKILRLGNVVSCAKNG